MNLNYMIKPGRIWNLNESSLSTDPRKVKVVGAFIKASSPPSFANVRCSLITTITYRGRNVWDQ